MEYEIIGEKRFVEGKMYYAPGETDNGFCYKNESLFKNHPDEICYIPESAFMDLEPVEIDGWFFYREEDLNGYTRRDIEKACKGYVDGEGEPIDAESLFGELDWPCPCTIINGWYDLEECGQIIIE